MRRETRSVSIKCDFCHAEGGMVREVRIPLSYSVDLVNYVVVTVHGHLPYATANGDVCKECFKKAIEKWLSETTSGGLHEAFATESQREGS